MVYSLGMHTTQNVMARVVCGLGLVGASAALAQQVQAQQAPPPPAAVAFPVAERRVVTDAYHGVKVEDPYRWLEDWNDVKVQEWSAAQNGATRRVLDGLSGVEKIRTRAKELLGAEVTTYAMAHGAGMKLFALKRTPPKQQPMLVVRGLPGAEVSQAGLGMRWASDERVVLDLNEFDTTGGTSIDWYVPSPDGTLVAIALSSGGSEMADVKVFDVATGKQVHETIERVSGGTAGGSLAWARDGKGFYYTRYPREGERDAADMNFYVQVYYHQLGESPSSDRSEIGKEFPKIAEIMLDTGASDGRVLCSVQKGDGGEFMHFVRLNGTAGSVAWRQFTTYEDKVVQAALSSVGDVFAVSRKGAERGKVVKFSFSPFDKSLDKVQDFIPEHATDAIATDFFDPDCFVADANKLFVTYQAGGPSRVAVFDVMGKERAAPKLGDVTAVTGVSPVGAGSVVFAVSSYMAPTKWMYWGQPGLNATVEEIPSWTPGYGKLFDMSKYQVRRVFATSKDGTKVPVNIVCRPDVALDGKQPVLLTGYGGYGVCITPSFGLRDAMLLEKGFILAEANIRGGGEYGEPWHREGNLLKKQNVFDDFIACAEWLIANNYCTKETLAIEGGSNGGLLMGAAFTQRPELFRCVVSHVGIYDMLRVELSPNGAFNITEFGTVADKAQFEALHAYSPYHRVKAGVAYPPVLFLTGANDPRVDPMQSRKMTALMQSVGGAALLRTSGNTGHGAGTPLSARVEQTVDVVAFLSDKLGVRW
jgi:prolyl oligopeptidase